jgi:hypothetical protein
LIFFPSHIFLPHIYFFVGCASHALNLLAKDLVGDKDSLFGDLTDFVTDVADVVTCFTRSNILRAKLREVQTERKLPSLVRFVPTRWCSLKRFS